MVDYRLYVITERWQDRRHLDVARAAIEGGATVVQFREKELPEETVLAEARAIAELCRQAGVTFIVNDSVELAQLCGANGVHVGQTDAAPAAARQALGAKALVGVSAAVLGEALPHLEVADYLGVGPVVATATKPDAAPAIGTAGLADICRAVTQPVVAIGGINEHNAAACIAAGAAGIAVISAVSRADDMAAAARRLRAVVEEALARHAGAGRGDE